MHMSGNKFSFSLKAEQRPFARPHSALVILLLALLLLPALARASGGSFFKYGTIATKGLVLDESGHAIWVEYDREGKVVREIAKDQGLGNLKVISPAAYLHAYGERPGLVIPEGSKAVLVNTDTGEILATSAVNIGYRTAFYTSDGPTGPIDSQGLVGYSREQDRLWGPISGARVWVSGWDTYTTMSDEQGNYTAKYVITPCPGFTFEYNFWLFAEMRFQKFNPKGNSLGSYYDYREFKEFCSGVSEGFFPTTLAGLIQKSGMQMLEADAAANYKQYNYNFAINMAMLSGEAALWDREGGSVIPLAPVTEYGYSPTAFADKAPGHLDLDANGQPDQTRLNEDGTVSVWLGDSDPGTDPPDITRLADQDPDLGDQGLVKSISKEDLQDTVIHVFRVANDQLVFSREDFYSGWLNDISRSSMNYRLMIRGPAYSQLGDKADLLQFQANAQVNPELRGWDADHIRVGEQVKVIIVNQATGYMGSAVGTYGAGLASALVSVSPPAIALRPPNLRIRAERVYDVESGLTAGEKRDYLIGYEGAGLTSDTFIRITTEWYDHDGSPLPPDLPGYTGRLAKVAAPNTLAGVGGRIENFEIRPGTHTQLLHLPLEEIDRSHFYIHVSGEPVSGNPNFASVGAGSGPLAYRPQHYVPVQVPIFDEEATGLARLTDPAADPVYQWVYRPEMQFSLYEMERMEAQKPQQTIQCANTVPYQLDSENILTNFRYTLTEDVWQRLAGFGPEPQLIFSYAGLEQEAQVGATDTLDLLSHRQQFASLDTDAIQSLLLLQNNDAVNILWEYQAIDIAIRLQDESGERHNIPVGESARVVAKTIPANRPVTWSLLRPHGTEARAVIDRDDGLITALPDSGSGWVIIRAVDKEYPEVRTEAAIFIGCTSCVPCTVEAGREFVALSSVDASFSLGKAADGRPAGNLFLWSEEMSPDLASPQKLFFSTLVDGVTPYYDADGAIRQVVTPQGLVDVVSEGSGYQIRFYPASAIAGKEDGWFTVADGAQPLTTWGVALDAGSTLTLTGSREGESKTYQYRFDGAANSWSLEQGGGLAIASKAGFVNGDNDLVSEEEVRDSEGRIASRQRITRHRFPWGEEEIARVEDPDGAALTTTTSYYADPAQGGSYGKVQERINADGSWRRYQYDDQGRLSVEVEGYNDAPATAATDTVRATYYDYAPVDPADGDAPEFRSRPRTVESRVQGITVAKEFHAYTLGAGGERQEIGERCPNPALAAYGDPDNLRTVTTYNPPDSRIAGHHRVKSIQHPDGLLESYGYDKVQFAYAADPGASTVTPGGGTFLRTMVIHGTVQEPEGVPYKSSREVTISDWLGNEVMAESHGHTGSGYERVAWTVNFYDDQGRQTKSQQGNGLVTEKIWDCCATASTIDTLGVTTSFSYDALHRLLTSSKEGSAGQPAVTTTYTYDAAGRRLGETVTGGDLSLVSSSEYDPAGRVVRTSDQAGLETRYLYELGGRRTVVTRPGGATEISEHYLDGRLKSVTGTAVVASFYEYGVEADGGQWTKVFTGPQLAASPRWEKSTIDPLGRTIRVERPGATGVEITSHTYNRAGQLIRTSSSGVADTLIEYDGLGNQVKSGLDVNANGILEADGPDRVAETETRYVADGVIWHESVSRRHGDRADGTPMVATTSRQRTQLTGLGEAGGLAAYPNALLTSQGVTIDIHGNESRSLVYVDRAAKSEARVSDVPDATVDAVTIAVNGLPLSSRSTSGVTLTFAYDSLGRRTGVTDARTGTTLTVYNDKGQVAASEDAAGNRTTLSYDVLSGQRIGEKNPLGKETRYAYNAQGQLIHTWGDAAYPVAYEYDDYGQRVSMTTFRGADDFSGESWPAAISGPADTTRWHFQEATGLLQAKEDAAGHQVTYTYSSGGKLATRTWARSEAAKPQVTSYQYDQATAELLAIAYADATPAITFTYDRLGRQQRVEDGVGVHAFTYNDALQLSSEAITGLYTITQSRTYEESGVVGRPSGFHLDNGYGVHYGYQAESGRLASIDWQAGAMTGNATYTYLPDSDLLQQVTTAAGQQTLYSYEPHRNLRTGIENSFNGQIISHYGYSYDALGRRTLVSNSGQAFSGPKAGSTHYGYNDRSELTSSRRYQGSDPADLTTPIAAEGRGYAYDPIGNRTAAQTWNPAQAAQEQLTYSANRVNQYELISSDLAPEQTLLHDQDGNLTHYQGQLLTYNGENRLIAVEPETVSEHDSKVEFRYDYMGRRASKTLSTWDGSQWQTAEVRYFVYDGWNLVAELDGDGVATAEYAWGLDLSQSLQGAGGVGGLLARVDSGAGKELHYCYDANGNVGQVVDAAGALAAAYEYDPYGVVIAATGAAADENPFRFSSKYFDGETGLYYYGFRYYEPEIGRWVTRDPIGEKGGLNLYAHVSNEPISSLDPLGQKAYTAYRELGLPGGSILWNLLQSSGHVYLAFKVAGDGLTKAEENKWCAFLSSKGFTKTDHPMRGAKEYNEWITFSFHPISVSHDTGTTEGNQLLTLITTGSFIDLNNVLNDIDPIIEGDATKNLISGDFESEKKLFERALQSLSAGPRGGQDFSRKLGDEIPAILKTYQNYGFLRYNCGGWAKYIVGQSGLTWPLGSYFYNFGVGVDGPLQYPALVIDTAIRTGYQIFENVEVVTPSNNDDFHKNQQSYIGLKFSFY